MSTPKRWGNTIPKGPLTPHFQWKEFACNCCGRLANLEAVRATAEVAEQLRARLGGRPMHINSGCRCPAKNARTPGAATDSLHMGGFAFDFTVEHMTPRAVWELLKDEWPGGLGRYEGFTHCDRGKRRRWKG